MIFFLDAEPRLKDLGLDPNWDSHDFSDQEEGGCGKKSFETGIELTIAK